MTLSDLKNGEKGFITKVRGRGAFRKRIIEMGFIQGKEVIVIKNAPLKDPIEYKIMDYNVSLRRSEAELIDVVTPDEILKGKLDQKFNGHRFFGNDHQKNFKQRMKFKKRFFDEHLIPGKHKKPRRKFRNRHSLNESDIKLTAEKKAKTINVALVGNPNSGKTTLFNNASGSHERVGNYSGVTVEATESTVEFEDYTLNLIDLPGTYSITEYTPEELFVRNYIFNETPDLVVNVVDGSNIERNLYLTTQLIDMDIKVVVALNMYDEIEHRGDSFDFETLGKLLGIPFVPTIGSKGSGIHDLFKKVIEVYEDKESIVRHIHINYGHDIERSIEKIQGKIFDEKNKSLTDKFSSRFLSIKLLEKDTPAEMLIFGKCENSIDILTCAKKEIENLESHLGEDTETLITDAKYGFISGALRETYEPAKRPDMSFSEKIDRFITSGILGFPIFLGIMWLTFHLTFTLGEYPMNWIDSFIGHLSDFITFKMPAGMLKELIVDGIIAGVGGVVIFLPNILILFFMISLMEDTGYMARASFIMDKLMHKIGLHGKSFIPMIMGFGCNVPAIMATRSLESKKDRILTMLIIPFMSCSARLPVYVLFISAFFAANSGTVLFSIYIIGIVIGIISALILKRTFFRKVDVPFVMELPPYRKPHLKSTMSHMWEKAAEYLKKIGGVILIASIIIWAAGKFPEEVDYSKDYDSEISTIKTEYNQKLSDLKLKDKTTIENIKKKMDGDIAEIESLKRSEHLEKSFIGMIGKTIEPVMDPLGFDWKMGVSLITGLAAKEIVVSTMGVLYQAEDSGDGSSVNLADKLKSHKLSNGNENKGKPISPLAAFSFMIFVLLYYPCVAAIVAIKKESGSWKWAIFTALYTTIVAYGVTFLIYQIGSLII